MSLRLDAEAKIWQVSGIGKQFTRLTLYVPMEALKEKCHENFVLTETVGFLTRPYRYAGTTVNICVLSL